MNKKTILTALLAIVVLDSMAQTSFDPNAGCLNVIDFSVGQEIGEYGDRCISVNNLHRK